MRSIPVVALFCLILAGCTDADWDRAMHYAGFDEAATPPQVTESMTRASQSSKKNSEIERRCSEIARLRVHDASYDKSLANSSAQIYQQALMDCEKWSLAHPE
jgi:hypothetical protein